MVERATWTHTQFLAEHVDIQGSKYTFVFISAFAVYCHVPAQYVFGVVWRREGSSQQGLSYDSTRAFPKRHDVTATPTAGARLPRLIRVLAR